LDQPGISQDSEAEDCECKDNRGNDYFLSGLPAGQSVAHRTAIILPMLGNEKMEPGGASMGDLVTSSGMSKIKIALSGRGPAVEN
jgi:hypothetical protein